ncbi:MAG: hypothetical protein KA248_04575 [Kiritimatiellae bacterium]|nr:hypothetical protein [Kiritimatiellia bacterium]
MQNFILFHSFETSLIPHVSIWFQQEEASALAQELSSVQLFYGNHFIKSFRARPWREKLFFGLRLFRLWRALPSQFQSIPQIIRQSNAEVELVGDPPRVTDKLQPSCWTFRNCFLSHGVYNAPGGRKQDPDVKMRDV